MTALCIGIDMACESFSAAVWNDGEITDWGNMPNNDDGIDTLLNRVRETWPERAVRLTVEPTGGYEQVLLYRAHSCSCEISRPNPRQVRDWARAKGQRAKTDRIDARLLAEYGAKAVPTLWQPLQSVIAELETLNRRRDDLTKLLQEERNRRHSQKRRVVVADEVLGSIDRVIQVLEGELKTVDDAIQQRIDADQRLQHEFQQLQTVPGVGQRTGVALLLMCNHWHHLTNGKGSADSLVAYVGLDPVVYESGTSVRRRPGISRMGDRQARQRLVMAALGGTRGKNPLTDFYQCLVGRGKPKMVALVASARKLLVWAWKVYSTDTPFDATKAGRRKALAT